MLSESRAMQWAAKVSSLAENAHALTLEAAASASSRRYLNETKPAEISKLLESRSDRDKLDGMRRIVAMCSRGNDMSEHFASVVKNVASPLLEIRKLVYIYLAQYAETEPDLALLSINTIQKALSDHNQLARALALRVMSSIRVQMISAVVLIGINKCSHDTSPYVRKTAALAVAKNYVVDPSGLPKLVECLQGLLADQQATVVASALDSFAEVCPDRIELLHPHFRRICSLLKDMDEFDQVNVLDVLIRYARQCFTYPREVQKKERDVAVFYDDEKGVVDTVLDQDYQLLLLSVLPLFHSRSSAAVMAAVRVYRHLAPTTDTYKVVPPMIGLLRNPSNVQYIVLTNIAAIALEDPDIWQSYVKHFFVYPSDAVPIWRLKLEILVLIVSEQSSAAILSELRYYTTNLIDTQQSRAAIGAIGRCVQRVPSLANDCLEILLSNAQSKDINIVSASVTEIRHLIQMNPEEHVLVIKRMIRSLETLISAAARASVYWLTAEYVHLVPTYAPDVLRIGAKTFIEEEETVKMQILVLATKMYVLHSQDDSEKDVADMDDALAMMDKPQTNSAEQILGGTTAVQEDTEKCPTGDVATVAESESPIPKLYTYITTLARYDQSFDLRDRLRTYKVLTSSPSWILTQKLLFSPKPMPHTESLVAGKGAYVIGSSSLMLDMQLRGYEALPNWADEVQGSAERNVPETVINRYGNGSSGGGMPSTSASMPPTREQTPTMSRTGSDTGLARGKLKMTGIQSLDDFYNTSSEEDEDEDEDEDDEGEGEGEEEEAEGGETEEDEEEGSGEEESESESESNSDSDSESQLESEEKSEQQPREVHG